MTTRRKRILLVFLLPLAGIVISAGLRVRARQHQYSLDRQLIATLLQRDANQSLRLLEEGADPNTLVVLQPVPSLRNLWDYLLHRPHPPVEESPTAFCIACGACWLDEAGGAKAIFDSETPQVVNLARVMLQHGAKPNMRDTSGWTPLLYAVFLDRPKTAELLLGRGADPDFPAADGTTPLYVAKRDASLEMIDLLQRAGAKKYQQPQTGRSY